MVQPSLGLDGNGEWLGGKSPQWSERRARLEELIATLRIADELAAGKYLITSGELAELMDVHTSAVTSRGEEWIWRNWQISRVRRESNQILWQLERIDIAKEQPSELPSS
ncbi:MULTISPECIES: hypothetical protein [unclassified Thermosynechococcus]|uniref:hypothetical protein n=1 Tax=unclassified Thermosynechococcus TaxID=2622553 RepID=UPI00197E1078|nr:MULTISPECIES: hypothetical protein [unclassified Thermosynechococcus]MDR5638195.1 hypothetical protein [Thermosynechococcus sp. PP42]MDR7920884.1 hypothetical protein [Thermosynechococcus sp. HY213]QSF49500.1 hypothetical protein JW907_01560 [Thermosynechococcus sp. TA-1]WKT81522.1 hypothetical protein QYC27_01575 [Thermosynechococcus sp. PP45]WNC25134.1 hypothetical protein RHH26_01575 [Thermosynechococcus sp. PP551]